MSVHCSGCCVCVENVKLRALADAVEVSVRAGAAGAGPALSRLWSVDLLALRAIKCYKAS